MGAGRSGCAASWRATGQHVGLLPLALLLSSLYSTGVDCAIGGEAHVPANDSHAAASIVLPFMLHHEAEREQILGRCMMAYTGSGYHSPHWEWTNHFVRLLRSAFTVTYGALKTLVTDMGDGTMFVATGDIPAMWIRDSAAQVKPLLRFSKDVPQYREVVFGTLKRQAFYIAKAPYANAYRKEYVPYDKLTRDAIRLNRTEWISTYNYELDSGCYFIKLLYEYHQVHSSDDLSFAIEAINALVNIWILEQHHEENSKYRYVCQLFVLYNAVELPRNGLGPPVGYTGMTWSAHRPSDNQHKYGYPIYSNAFVVQVLEYVQRLFPGESQLLDKAKKLQTDIRQGIQEYGTTVEGGKTIYCFEVDGLGGCAKMDDANVPSLLALPYLDPEGLSFDMEIYANTREFVLSKNDPFFYTGSQAVGMTSRPPKLGFSLRLSWECLLASMIDRTVGIGSSHTRRGYIWHMAIVIQGLTAQSPLEKEMCMMELVGTDAGRNLLHESFQPSNPALFSRELFAWNLTRRTFSSLTKATFGKACCEAFDAYGSEASEEQLEGKRPSTRNMKSDSKCNDKFLSGVFKAIQEEKKRTLLGVLEEVVA
eukprot:scaffold7355_cov497-Prasinococcus_capsulatus_cf.AAC.1